MEPHTALNNLDYIVLGIILLSAVFALFRGFVREVLSLLSWTGAYFAAAKYHHLAEPYVHRYIKNESLITPIAMTAVFLITLIVLTIISMIIARVVRGGTLTAIDRSLGFLFGVLRGGLIVCIVYMAVVAILWPELDKTPEEQTKTADEDKNPNHPPAWLMEARTRPALAYGSKILRTFIPKDELEKSTKGAQAYIEQEYDKQKLAVQKAVEQQQLDTMSTPVPGLSVKPATPPNYDDKNRYNLDNLVKEKGR